MVRESLLFSKYWKSSIIFFIEYLKLGEVFLWDLQDEEENLVAKS